MKFSAAVLFLFVIFGAAFPIAQSKDSEAREGVSGSVVLTDAAGTGLSLSSNEKTEQTAAEFFDSVQHIRSAVPDSFFPYEKRRERSTEQRDVIGNDFSHDERTAVPDSFFPYGKQAD